MNFSENFCIKSNLITGALGEIFFASVGEGHNLMLTTLELGENHLSSILPTLTLWPFRKWNRRI